MANAQYDQLPALIAGGFDWERVTVYAFLYEGAVFNPTHKRVSDVGGWIKREPLQGRFTDQEGNFCGQPAVFYMVLPNTRYQVVLAYDDGTHNELVLGFFDEGTEGPISIQRRGSLFVRPVTTIDGDSEPPSYSIWLRPEQA